jgi:hypothetical protein
MKGLFLLIAQQRELEKELKMLEADILYNPLITKDVLKRQQQLVDEIALYQKELIPEAEKFYDNLIKFTSGAKPFIIDNHPRWKYVNNTLPLGTFVYGTKFSTCTCTSRVTDQSGQPTECGKTITANTGVVYTENPITGQLQYLCDYCLIDLINQKEKNERERNKCM